jgi:hypothetical protein
MVKSVRAPPGSDQNLAPEPLTSNNMSKQITLLPDEDLPSVSREAVEELRKIIKEDTGKELSDQEAWDMARSLLRLGHTLMQGGRGKTEKSDPSPADVAPDVRDLLDKLVGLGGELARTEKDRQSWRWASVTLHDLLRATFVHALQTRWAKSTTHLDPSTWDLERLFRNVRDEYKLSLGPTMTRSIAKLARIKWSLASLHGVAWSLLAETLPAMARDCLGVLLLIVEHPDIGYGADAKERVRAAVEKLDDLLLDLEAATLG